MAPLNLLVAAHPVLDAPVVRSAYIAAARAHAGQARKSGEPVLAHCLATAVILAELGLPEETVAAGLLHDVLSDTSVTPVQLEEYVPRSCVELVEKVTRLSELSQLYRDNTHTVEAAAMLDMLTSMSDVSALLVKLADRLHNMRTIGALARCKQVRMASETLDVFAVLANRLGAWSVKAELEDLAFKTLQPEDYQQVRGLVVALGGWGHCARVRRPPAVAVLLFTAPPAPALTPPHPTPPTLPPAQISTAIEARAAAADLPARVAQARAALEAAGLDVVDVSGRVKNAYGVWKKLQKAGLGVEGLDRVHDVAALRVVVPHKHDCYVALRAVEAAWAPVPGRFKDYVRSPKANGYQSLHTSVRAGPPAAGGDDEGTAAAAAAAAAAHLEVQIRTPKMHYIAEYGFAAHWRYKERLAREDLWLDRLVRWKKWVAADKLRLRDAKVRAGDGSPQRDPAIVGLAAAAAGASADGEDAAASPASPPRAAGSPSGGSPAAAAELDARFMARFSIAPVSDADLEGRDASILVSGPRGVRVLEVAGGTTLAQLLAGGRVSEAEARRCSVQLNGRAVPVLGRRELVLRPGDHVAFVAEPNLVPRGAAPGAGGELPVFGAGGAPVEAALGRRLATSSSRLRQAALAL
jgi:GTP pyrophosphokinase